MKSCIIFQSKCICCLEELVVYVVGIVLWVNPNDKKTYFLMFLWWYLAVQIVLVLLISFWDVVFAISAFTPAQWRSMVIYRDCFFLSLDTWNQNCLQTAADKCELSLCVWFGWTNPLKEQPLPGLISHSLPSNMSEPDWRNYEFWIDIVRPAFVLLCSPFTHWTALRPVISDQRIFNKRLQSVRW